ncbi:TPA: accessory Sec system protein Asp2 [Streptococcus suis]|nr:accessory Sec system protein Asp2 [Streptococcus suis]
MGIMHILQVGESDWFASAEVPEGIEWHFASLNDLRDMANQDDEETELSLLLKAGGKPLLLSALLVTSSVEESELEILSPYLDPYTTFLDENGHILNKEKRGFFARLCPRELPQKASREETLRFLQKNLFSGQYGDKLKVTDIDIMPTFQGEVVYDGFVKVDFDGFFGHDFQPLFTYRYNIMADEKLTEIWQEYIKDDTCQLALEVVSLSKGSISDILDRRMYTEEDLAAPIQLPDIDSVGYYCLTFFAKGQGKISVGSCHRRFSRSGLGQFIMGGKRHVDENRQEIFTYFHPGDMKPPLNVYFSGFRPAEGFEGYYMMKKMGAPFLLVSDPRLEGGCFYLGTDSLEQQIVQAIRGALDYLDFDSSQLILSGLSMGAFGGLYYASWLEPHAVVVGKPFTNLGDVVTNLKLKRPDEFETSGDMLHNVVGRNETTGIQLFNLRFWEKFAQADFSKTKFAIAYMENDDYDPEAIWRLIDFMSEDQVHIFAKGYEGRHNDNSMAINKWFLNQYYKILSHDFERNI